MLQMKTTLFQKSALAQAVTATALLTLGVIPAVYALVTARGRGATTAASSDAEPVS